MEKNKNCSTAHVGISEEIPVKPDYELISLFSNLTSAQRSAMRDLIAAVANGDFTLDNLGKSKAEAYFGERLKIYEQSEL